VKGEKTMMPSPRHSAFIKVAEKEKERD